MIYPLRPVVYHTAIPFPPLSHDTLADQVTTYASRDHHGCFLTATYICKEAYPAHEEARRRKSQKGLAARIVRRGCDSIFASSSSGVLLRIPGVNGRRPGDEEGAVFIPTAQRGSFTVPFVLAIKLVDTPFSHSFASLFKLVEVVYANLRFHPLGRIRDRLLDSSGMRLRSLRANTRCVCCCKGGV